MESAMTNPWLIACDSVHARVFEVDGAAGAIREIADAASDSTSTSRHLAEQSSDLLRTVEFFSLKSQVPTEEMRDIVLENDPQPAEHGPARDAA